MTLFEELERRGLIAQLSHEKEIKNLLDKEKVSFYIGFDATANSLHVGHLLQLVVMRRMQLAGHKPIAVLGTGTTLVGDPSGRNDMRKILDNIEISQNAERFRDQMEKFLDFSEDKEDKAEILKNGDWLLNLNYLEFMREIGKHFSVNRMLAAECFKSRLEQGLTFLEFNYMLLQSYDFLHLYRTRNVKLELGGDDQWSNILSGMELIRRADKGEAYAMTFTLLLTKEGKKMGKTEKGALWLDKEKCSVYDFYQYFRNVDDFDVINCLKLLTFIPIEKIEEMENTMQGAQLNQAKEILAYELTEFVHGEDEAKKASSAAKSVFGAAGQSEDMPSTEISSEEFVAGKIGVLDILVKTSLCASKSDARRNIEQGGVSVDGIIITNPNDSIEIKDFVIIKKGKKSFHKVMKK